MASEVLGVKHDISNNLHPLQFIYSATQLFLLSSPNAPPHIKYNKAWLNTNVAKTLTEKHIASIHGNFAFTCIHTLRLQKRKQKRGFLYEIAFLPGSNPIWVLSVL